MNTKLLRKVQQHILEEPRRLNMGTWHSTSVEYFTDPPPCGTVACIAGWAVKLAGKRISDRTNFETLGASVLGLNAAQANRLFEPPFEMAMPPRYRQWPRRFQRRYLGARSAKARARITSERIDWFIKTKGRE